MFLIIHEFLLTDSNQDELSNLFETIYIEILITKVEIYHLC